MTTLLDSPPVRSRSSSQPALAARPALTIVIPTLNRERRLRQTIESLLQQTFQDWELIVIDQSANVEPSARWIAQLHDERISHRTMHPPSVTRARNLGISLANAELVIFIDDDVDLLPGFFDAYVEAFSDRTVDAVAGRVIWEGWPPGEHLLTIKLGGIVTGTFDCPADQDAGTAQGCNMGFRKAALLEADGFDTRFTENALREESDLCFRLRKLGCRIVYRKNAALTHVPEAVGGCRANGGNMLRQIATYRNETLFFLKHWPLWRTPRFAWNQLYRLAWGSKPPKTLCALTQLIYLPAGFISGVWIYLTKKPATITGPD